MAMVVGPGWDDYQRATLSEKTMTRIAKLGTSLKTRAEQNTKFRDEIMAQDMGDPPSFAGSGSEGDASVALIPTEAINWW